VAGPWTYGDTKYIPNDNGGDRRSPDFILKSNGITTVENCMQINLKDPQTSAKISMY
jgi:hypothetical protein